ncbi:MAG: hypothetical protein HOH31_05820 [Campylobacteraceae bacterium]|jgi:hypothetical protein|nr:hypothetical protein [Campylobacteraceae bacterium]
MIITPYIIPTTSDISSIRTHLADLKVLEDKYTKDLALRLEKRKLQIKKEDKQRVENIEDITNTINNLDEDDFF